MTNHPLCDQGLALIASRTGNVLSPSLAERLAALFAALKPMETFANEATDDACETERARSKAIGAGESLPLRPRKSP